MSGTIMPFSHWAVWAQANTEKKAREVLSRLLKKMGREDQMISIQAEEKFGYLIRFRVELESETQNDAIIECFTLGQRVASGWCLIGDVRDDPGGFSNHVSDSGVGMLEWGLHSEQVQA
jgi:hypothetical protein